MLKLSDFDLDSLSTKDRLTLLNIAMRLEVTALHGNLAKAAQLQERIVELLTKRGALRTAEEVASPPTRSRTPSVQTVEKLLQLRRSGFTLEKAAALVGVHVATVCRWQARNPALRQSLLDAQREARTRIASKEPRPGVRWRRDCPLCKARVVVRTARGNLPFWRCGRWPLCEWASWRPRAPRNCKHCRGPCFWSHSRKSISCSVCGVRIKAH